jgi:hypothetical protein
MGAIKTGRPSSFLVIFLVVFLHFVAYTSLAANEWLHVPPKKETSQTPVYDRLGAQQVAHLSTKIRRMVGAKRPPDEQRLMGWHEDALDLENACRNWEKAAELRQSKIRRSLANRFTPVA